MKNHLISLGRCKTLSTQYINGKLMRYPLVVIFFFYRDEKEQAPNILNSKRM
jgi:hypothetical protein